MSLVSPEEEKMYIFHPYVEYLFIDNDLYLVDYYYGDINKISNINKTNLGSINELIPRFTDETLNELINCGMIVDNTDVDFSQITLKSLQKEFFAQKNYLHVILLPTENCNFRCTYCFETFNSRRMSVETIKAVKKYIANKINDYEGIFVEWFGGEPLLEIPTIIDICKYTKQLCDIYSKDYFSHITTNGYLLNIKNATTLIDAGVNSFTITLDGEANTHDKTRVLRNGEGTFYKIFKNIIDLSKSQLDFKLKFRCNLTKDNIKSIDSLIDLISSFASTDCRMNDINIRPVFNYDGMLSDTDMILERNIGLKHVYSLLKKSSELNLHDKSISFNFELGGCVCYAGEIDTFIIGADGALMKCSLELRNNPYNIVGQLLPNGTLEINHRLNDMWCNKECEIPSKCETCPRLASCMGNACPKVRLTEKKVACPDALEQLHQSLELLTIAEIKDN